MTPAERRFAVLASIKGLAPHYGFTRVDPLLVLSQAILESGHFTSNLVVTQNNAFGMMQPRQRPNVSDGPGPTGFACYADLFASVQDYFLRQRYFGIQDTSDPVAYANATKASGYATDPQYVDKWLAVYRSQGQQVPPVDQTGGQDQASGEGVPPVDQAGTGMAMGLLLLLLAAETLLK